jgi:hypothetical protein
MTTNPQVSWTPNLSLFKYPVYASFGRGCAQAVSRPHVWASHWQAAQAEVVWVMGTAYGIGKPVSQ